MAAPKTDKLLEINLLPAEHKFKKLDLSWMSDSRIIWSTLALVIMALTMAMLYYHVVETIDELEKAVAMTRQAVEKERPLLKKIDELEAKQKEIAKKSKALQSIQSSRKRWVVLFENLSTSLPPNTWITNITQSGAQMNMNCATWNFSEVALYMLKLEQEESVTSVKLTNINALKMDGEDAYNFSLNVDFKDVDKTEAEAEPEAK